MDLSRFQINEFKTFLVAAVILAGASGAERVWQREVSATAVWSAGGGVLVVAAGLALSLDHGGGAKRLLGLALPFVLIAVATVLLVGLVRSRPGTARAAVAAFGVLLTAGVSGLGFAYLVTSTWASSRVNVEVGHYGAEVSELVSAQPCDAVTERRPARRRARHRAGGLLARRIRAGRRVRLLLGRQRLRERAGQPHAARPGPGAHRRLVRGAPDVLHGPGSGGAGHQRRSRGGRESGVPRRRPVRGTAVHACLLRPGRTGSSTRWWPSRR